MRSKVVLLLLAALQVSHCSKWRRPHIIYYNRGDETQESAHGSETSGAKYYEPHHDQQCDIKPIYEDQHEEGHVRRNDLLADEDKHEDSGSSNDSRGYPFLGGACQIFVNPIRPPYGETVGRLSPEQGSSPPDIAGFSLAQSAGPLINSIKGLHEGILKPRPCGIFMNLNRSPYEKPTGQLVASPNIGRPQSNLEHEAESDSNVGEILPSEAISFHGAPISGGIALQHGPLLRLQLPGSEISRAPVLPEDFSGNALLSPTGPIGATPLAAFLPPGIQIPLPGPIARPSPTPLPLPSAGLLSPGLPSLNVCVRHKLVPVPVQVVEDCITNVPLVRKTVRHHVETITRHVPIVEKTVTQQHEKIVRHVPISGKTVRNVVESRIRHIPVIKSRSRTVVEPYTVHIPVTVRFTRPVEESVTRTIPVREVRIRPVVTSKTRFVPVVERRIRPVVEQRIEHFPVKRQFLRTVVEQRVRPVVGNCQPCHIASIQPPGFPLSLAPTADFPSALVSSPNNSGFSSSSGTFNSFLGSSLPPSEIASSESDLSGSIGLHGGNAGITDQPIHIQPAGHPSLSNQADLISSEGSTILPSRRHTLPHHHITRDC